MTMTIHTSDAQPFVRLSVESDAVKLILRDLEREVYVVHGGTTDVRLWSLDGPLPQHTVSGSTVELAGDPLRPGGNGPLFLWVPSDPRVESESVRELHVRCRARSLQVTTSTGQSVRTGEVLDSVTVRAVGGDIDIRRIGPPVRTGDAPARGESAATFNASVIDAKLLVRGCNLRTAGVAAAGRKADVELVGHTEELTGCELAGAAVQRSGLRVVDDRFQDYVKAVPQVSGWSASLARPAIPASLYVPSDLAVRPSQ